MLKMDTITLADGTTYNCQSTALYYDDNTNKPIRLTTMISIKENEPDVLLSDILNKIETIGVSKVSLINDKLEFDTPFKTVYPDFIEHKTNEKKFYLGFDEEAEEEVYAKSIIVIDISSDAFPQYIDNYKKDLINRLSSVCHDTIVNGLDIKLSDGKTEHFTYNEQDQINIKEAFDIVVSGVSEYPYHRKGGELKLYKKEDIIKIYTSLNKHKTEHTTYYNQLKQYILDTQKGSELHNIDYGYELKDNYLKTYNTIVDAISKQMDKLSTTS